MSKALVDAKARRRPVDLVDYVRRSQSGPCFVCEIVAGNPEYRHHVVYEDDATIAFLNKYPTLYGYTLVAPKAHREQVTGSFTLHHYLELQRVIHAVAEAVRKALTPERVYILSLGSQQANTHVHWHVVPCPPGVPFEQQQLSLLNAEERGVLQLSQEEEEALASRLRARLPAWMQTRQP